MPAPCESGATTSEASRSVVPGNRSAKWLVTTNAIWPCVSTAALGRPVVPEVKKNQQGSVYSTSASWSGADGVGMGGEAAVAQHGAGAGGGGEVGDLGRRQPEVGRHPDRAELEGGP